MSTAAIAQQTFHVVTPQKSLGPESPVTIVFRGGPPIVDKWDGQDIVIPEDARQAKRAHVRGWDKRHYPAAEVQGVPWAVASHVKSRAIVPGTRNPHDGTKALRRIGILSTPTGQFQDTDERCRPFTEEELSWFDNPEGLDRTQFEDGRSKVETLSTMASISHVGNVSETLNAEPDEADLAPTGEGTRDVQQAAAGYDGTDASRVRRGRPRFKDDQ
jgi:hypothetical protein